MSPKLAFRLLLGFWLISITIAIWHTFFDQNLIGALIGISSAYTMYFLLKNHKLLMAKNFGEFGDLYDSSRDKKYLWGTPLSQLLIIIAVLYILIV